MNPNNPDPDSRIIAITITVQVEVTEDNLYVRQAGITAYNSRMIDRAHQVIKQIERHCDFIWHTGYSLDLICTSCNNRMIDDGEPCWICNDSEERQKMQEFTGEFAKEEKGEKY